MTLNSIAKNGVFMAILAGSTGLLFYLLTAQAELPTPRTFHPESDAQRGIRATADAVSSAFENTWKQQKIEVAAHASDFTVARRLSLALTGTIPSVQELKTFEQQPAEQRIHFWVSRLLEDSRCNEYLAERLARSLVGVEQGPFVVYRRRRFVNWLTQELEANRPYDELVRQLLSDDGVWTDSPAVNFYTRNIVPDQGSEDKPDPILLAGRTSRAFIGMRIDCLQCHDDFLGNIVVSDPDGSRNGEQTDFHQLAAFFGGTRNTFFGIKDIPNEEASWKYQLLDESEASELEPRVPYAQELIQDDLPLRDQLASWVTHPENRPFARAIVNRVWAIMSSRPMIEPVDHIPLDGPFLEPMEILVDDFIENGFDLKRLIRVIAESNAYQLESWADHEITGQHEKSLAVFPMSRLRGDQVAGAIFQSTSLRPVDKYSHIIRRMQRFGDVTQFVTRYGDPGENEFEATGETVTQKLLMFNGEMLNNRIGDNSYSTAHIAGLSPNTETAIETIFLATLSRRPTDEESEFFLRRFEEEEVINDAVKDLYWTLLNSLEFSWNH
jgi:hypothetical protein